MATRQRLAGTELLHHVCEHFMILTLKVHRQTDDDLDLARQGVNFAQKQLGTGVVALHQVIELPVSAGGKLVRAEIGTLDICNFSIEHGVHEGDLGIEE
jgi:hypothetical protein